METTFCENCGHRLRPQDMFCMNCGERVKQKSAPAIDPLGGRDKANLPGARSHSGYCPECGKRTLAGWVFCLHCGKKLDQGQPGSGNMGYEPPSREAKRKPPEPAPQGRDPWTSQSDSFSSNPDSWTSQSGSFSSNPESWTSQSGSYSSNTDSWTSQSGSFSSNTDSWTTQSGSFSSNPDSWTSHSRNDQVLGLDPRFVGQVDNVDDDEPLTMRYDDGDDTSDDALTQVYDDEKTTCTLVRESSDERFELDLPTTLGRGSKAKTRITGNPYIGREHVRIVEEDGTVLVEDLGSANHTFVNGSQIRQGEPCELHDGDTLTLAKENFSVYIARA